MITTTTPRMKVIQRVMLVLISVEGIWILVTGGPKWYYSLILFSGVGMWGHLMYLDRKIERLKRQLGR